MNIETVELLLDKGPYVVSYRSPLSLLLLSDFDIVDSDDLDRQLDDLNYRLPRRRIVIKSHPGRVARRLPKPIFLDETPGKEILNKAIGDKYAVVSSLLPRQSEVQKMISSVPKNESVVLVVVDGLSYEDSREAFPDSVPMLADGPTTTPEGIRRIIGAPTIAQRMFESGYKIVGYSYWTREGNPLTDEFFAPIPRQDLLRRKEFGEILEDLDKRDLFRTYVQIYMEGLDGVCHRCREYPPMAAILKEISERVSALRKVLEEKGIRSTIFVTSDHGILWNSENLQLIDDLQFKDKKSPRYTSGNIVRPFAKAFSLEGMSITSLFYPYISHPLKNNEWGVHGGISYEESIVPWYSMVVG